MPGRRQAVLQAYRLTEVTYPGPSTIGYVYDAFGNRISMRVDTDETTYAYDEPTG